MQRLHQSDAQDLAMQTAKLDLVKWPGPLLKLDLEQTTVGEVFGAAANPDAIKQRGQACEANLYTGEASQFQGDRATAKKRLKTARKNCPKLFYEHEGAVEELKRLRNVDAPAPAQ